MFYVLCLYLFLLCQKCRDQQKIREIFLLEINFQISTTAINMYNNLDVTFSNRRSFNNYTVVGIFKNHLRIAVSEV